MSTGGDLGTGRTDTILVVHLPGLGSDLPATMVSIPRDSYVDIPGYGSDKINAAYVDGGPALLAQTVEEATGLRLDHYAEVGFGGFPTLVDALGGVEVCPAEPISDPLAGIDLPAGCQTLDGRNALGYVRSRPPLRADLDRMIHQRQFMSALLHRASSPAVWLNPWRWYAIPHAAIGALTVDSDAHVWDLARLGWALHGSPTTVTVPIGEFTGSDSGSVVVWDADGATKCSTRCARTRQSRPRCSTPSSERLVEAGAGEAVLQPGLGAAGVVGGDPANPDVAAEADVPVVVDGPAVHRAAPSRGAVDEFGMLAQGGDRGPTAVAPTVVAALPPRYREVSPAARSAAVAPPGGCATRGGREAHHHRAGQVGRRRGGDPVAVQQREHLCSPPARRSAPGFGLDEQLHRPVPVQDQANQLVQREQAGVAVGAVRPPAAVPGAPVQFLPAAPASYR